MGMPICYAYISRSSLIDVTYNTHGVCIGFRVWIACMVMRAASTPV
jgi:hypothetical protein